MHRFYFFVLAIVVSTAALSAQNGLIGQGFATGFNNPADISFFGDGAGSTRILTTQSTGVGNQFFRLVRAWDSDGNGNDNSEFGPAATCNDGQDQFITNVTGTPFQGVGGCGTAFAIDVPNLNDFYVFKTPNPVTTTEFMFFRVEGPVKVFEAERTGQAPTPDEDGFVAAGSSVLVGNLLDNEGFSTGQAAYLRYTTDGFATSTVISMDGTNGFYTALIPGQPDGTVVTYYLFTSGDQSTPLMDGSDADYRTINLENNNGNNYTYTVNRALPVTYASWTGRRVKADVVSLNWSTASEDQASHFTLQCSQDGGRQWMNRARVPATNRTDGASYSFLDEATPTGDLQYRLEQTDFDGTATFSSILTVAGQQAGIEVWPQPAGEAIQLRTPATLTGTTATLTDLNGRTRRTFVLTGERQTVDLTGLSAGVYLLRAEGTDVRRVVIR